MKFKLGDKVVIKFDPTIVRTVVSIAKNNIGYPYTLSPGVEGSVNQYSDAELDIVADIKTPDQLALYEYTTIAGVTFIKTHTGFVCSKGDSIIEIRDDVSILN